MIQRPDPEPVRLAAHPRAKRSIRRVRGGAGLVTFACVLLLALRAGLTGQDALARALLGGVTAYFIAWAAAVTVWRQLVLAELEVAREAQARRREEAAAARRQAASR
jgi:hypothetical protein